MFRENEAGPCTGVSVASPSACSQPPDLKLLENRIAELSARIQAATYELLCYLREFDRHYGWEGFRSCAHWLNWRTGLDLGAAREKMRVAEALKDLNHVSAAMACGRLSYSKVRALTRVATPATEARLVAVACCATAAHVERLVRAWRQADRAAQPDAELVRLASHVLSTRVDEDGMVVLRARLTPEVGAVVLRALEAALEQSPAAAEGDDSNIGQRRADALGLLAESALAGGLDPANAGDRYQVTVHVDADALCSREAVRAATRVSAETRADNAPASEPAASASAHGFDAGQAVIEQAGGLHVGAEVARRIACDAGLVVLYHGLDGHAQCSTSGARRARSQPRCAAPWRVGIAISVSSPVAARAIATPTTSNIGPTAGRRGSPIWSAFAASTTARCTRRGFQVVADAAGQFLFLRPDGEPLPAVPPMAGWRGTGEPLAPTVARLEAAGITIGPHTATPEWYGETLNVVVALDALWEPPVAAVRSCAATTPD